MLIGIAISSCGNKEGGDRFADEFKNYDRCKLSYSDTLEINDSTFVVISVNDGKLSKIFTINGNFDNQQTIDFWENGIMKSIAITNYAMWKDTLQGQMRLYNTQKVLLDTIGVPKYYRLMKDFKILAESEE